MNSRNANSGSISAGRAPKRISKAALADAKFEGDFARIMTATPPVPATPAPATDAGAAPGASPAPGTDAAAPAGTLPATETPSGETQKEQPKN